MCKHQAGQVHVSRMQQTDRLVDRLLPSLVHANHQQGVSDRLPQDSRIRGHVDRWRVDKYVVVLAADLGKDLVAFRPWISNCLDGTYQVLSMPAPAQAPPARGGRAASIGELSSDVLRKLRGGVD